MYLTLHEIKYEKYSHPEFINKCDLKRLDKMQTYDISQQQTSVQKYGVAPFQGQI